MLLGGQMKQYRRMYEKAITVAKKYLLFRPMTVGDKDILIFGTVKAQEGKMPRHSPDIEHLTCFTGGMLAIAGRIFNRPEDVEDGAKLTDGCIWAYRNTVTGIMPEKSTAVPCENRTSCKWDMKKWYSAIYPITDEYSIQRTIEMNQLPPGFVFVQDAAYHLRYGFPQFPCEMTNEPADPRQSSQSSSCTGLQVTNTGQTAAGICSRLLRHKPKRNLVIPQFVMC
jgi:mannosyl-oligosaccharide alpha-1,2-mannosidase